MKHDIKVKKIGEAQPIWQLILPQDVQNAILD